MPYEKILELVEAKKLDITTVHLAEITGDFIMYMKKLEEQNDPAHNYGTLTHFVNIAARLLLIKSKALLPSLQLTPEEETDIKELEERLIVYKNFKELSKHILKEWRTTPYMKVRARELYPTATYFYPPQKLKASDLERIIRSLHETASLVAEPPEVTTIQVVSLETKIYDILNRFREIKKQNFSQLVHSSPSRGELVATFLAILHLLREDSIKVTQKVAFADMHIEKI